MRFQDFYTELTMHFCNHGTLTYSNYLFFQQFVDENNQTEPIAFTAFVPPGDKIEVSNQKIKELLTIYKHTFKINYSDGVKNIWINNSKYINARAINAYYETIKNYLEQRGKKEIYEFHNNYDWFRVLYILRQITSHGNKIFKNGIEFPDRGKTLGNKIKPYPNTITCQNISITRGQKTEIIFNELQISNLLTEVNIFFVMNNDFNVGISDIQNFQKPV